MAKLSEKQQELLDAIEEDYPNSVVIDKFNGFDLRTAQSLYKRCLIELDKWEDGEWHAERLIEI